MFKGRPVLIFKLIRLIVEAGQAKFLFVGAVRVVIRVILARQKTGETFNSCLLNLYHDGREGMAWHSDGEKDLKKNGAIASLSFGAERKFSFKHKKTKDTVSQILQHGSLLVMKGTTQTSWQHRLPPSKKVHTARINLTFRTIVADTTGFHG